MPTRSQDVLRRLREAILVGDYPPDSRLNEVDLASSFDVSRTPVRSALGTLAAEGLLHYRPNSGYVVRGFGAEDVLHVYEVRAALEGLAARLAAENGLPDALRDRMRAALSEGEAVARTATVDGARVEAWSRANERFHHVVFEACGNPHLLSVIERNRAVPLLRQMKFRWHHGRTVRRSQEEHEEILGAITARQGTRAEALVREHVLRFGQHLAREWRRTRAADPDGAVALLRTVA